MTRTLEEAAAQRGHKFMMEVDTRRNHAGESLNEAIGAVLARYDARPSPDHAGLAAEVKEALCMAISAIDAHNEELPTHLQMSEFTMPTPIGQKITCLSDAIKLLKKLERGYSPSPDREAIIRECADVADKSIKDAAMAGKPISGGACAAYAYNAILALIEQAGGE